MLVQMGPSVVVANLLMVWTFSIWPILLPLGMGTAVGLLAILLALLRSQESARKAARFSIVAGMLCVAVGLLPNIHYLAGDEPQLPPLAYVILAFPALLGAAALGICRCNYGREPVKRGQIPLSVILLGVTVLACVLAAFRVKHASYFQERDRHLRHFRSIPSVVDVRIEPWEHEGYYYVHKVHFRIENVPDSLVTLAVDGRGMPGKSDEDLRIISIMQIGPWQLYERDTSVTRNVIDLGTEGKYSSVVPIQVHSVGDIVEHYDELLGIFEDGRPSRDPANYKGIAVHASTTDLPTRFGKRPRTSDVKSQSQCSPE